jgi:hypothetical protein
MRKNRNRGYQKLIVWNDAIQYYVLTCEIFRSLPPARQREEFEASRLG